MTEQNVRLLSPIYFVSLSSLGHWPSLKEQSLKAKFSSDAVLRAPYYFPSCLFSLSFYALRDRAGRKSAPKIGGAVTTESALAPQPPARALLRFAAKTIADPQLPPPLPPSRGPHGLCSRANARVSLCCEDIVARFAVLPPYITYHHHPLSLRSSFPLSRFHLLPFFLIGFVVTKL